MCLAKRREPTKTDKKVKYGYKVFSVTKNGDLESELKGNVKYELNIWNKRKPRSSRISADSGALYKTGFHVFVLKRDAKAWKDADGDEVSLIVKKVKMRGITSIGVQWHRDCYVCDEMKILP